jgi:hypothetical protein
MEAPWNALLSAMPRPSRIVSAGEAQSYLWSVPLRQHNLDCLCPGYGLGYLLAVQNHALNVKLDCLLNELDSFLIAFGGGDAAG